MSGNRRFPRAKWVLPEVINPPERICFQIEVPKERFHLAAFRGALLNLASAVNWQDDPDHKAKDVAKVWDKIYLSVSVCEELDTNTGITLEDFMSQQIRISPDDSCIIQMWCIDHWEDWYNPKSCIASGSSQPGGAGTIEPGECRTFQARLDGNGKWLLPTGVSEGDTIQIGGAEGGWWDGNVLHAWNCPNGQTYALGACVSTGASDAGSPIPSQPIGRLIAQIGSNYYDAFNQTIPVPAGVTDENVYFQMNDATLGDNAGSVSFSVTVCKSGAALSGGITFSEGSGPTTIELGTEYVFNFTPGSDCPGGVDRWGLSFTLDRCLDIEVVNLVNFTSQVSIGCSAADGLLCPCGVGFSTPYTDPMSTDFSNQEGFNLNTIQAGTTVILKFTAP